MLNLNFTMENTYGENDNDNICTYLYNASNRYVYKYIHILCT